MVVEVFFQILWIQKRIEKLKAHREQNRLIQNIIRKQSDIGETSKLSLGLYSRTERNIEMQLQKETVELLSQKMQLSAWVRVSPDIHALGDLLPTSCSVSNNNQPPQIEALEHQMTAAQMEQNIARQSWLPNLNLQGSWIAVDTNNISTQGWGGQFGLSFPLSTSPSLRQKEEELRSLKAEHTLLKRNLKAERQAFTESCTRFLKLSQKAETGLQETQRLTEKTKQGYAAGYNSLDDLLNIGQALLNDQLFVLDLHYAARKSYMRSLILYGAQ